jgi:conjugal transfer pilus assembly protein TraU
MRNLLLLLLLLTAPLEASGGKIVNPLTDVCWNCMFPMTVSGVKAMPGKQTLADHKEIFCKCAGMPPKFGVPVTYWEPSRLIDVTRHAYKLVGLGGLSVGSDNIRNRGVMGSHEDGTAYSLYHVHYYFYPLLSVLELLGDFSCVERAQMDVAYLSELDPLWNDEKTAFMMHPEVGFFANLPAQAACIADCTAATVGRPLNALFWCAGCQGSLYPYTGFVGHHSSPIQASSLLVHRLLAKFHKANLLKGYPDNEYCEAQYMPKIKKTLYKTQLVYPVAQTKGPCNTLGKSGAIWGAGKSFPYKGEEFVYLIWSKRQCCLDAVKPALGGA